METKFCPKCQTPKSVSEFHRRGPYLMGYCKPCQCAYVRTTKTARHRYLRALIDNLKTGPCVDCGETHPPWAMDFDHLDPSQKSFSIGEAPGRNVKDETLLAEIAKCELVCALCHRYRTYGVKRVFPTTSTQA